MASMEALTLTADDIVGEWYSENKETVMDVYKSNGKYYGKLVSLKNPTDANGHPRRDVKNKNEKLQSRNLVGILIFWDMSYSVKNDRWEDGTVYDPDMGHTADCVITLINRNTIRVKGYVGFEWVSESQTWNRKSD